MAQRADSMANIMAIGTAAPSFVIEQSGFPDFYFRITKSEHMSELKQKFHRICKSTNITRRHFFWDEEFLNQHPSLLAYDAPSLGERHDIAVVEVPKLGMTAANKAMEEWGQPKSRITHLIFCSTTGTDLPGADYELTKLLGLRPSVHRLMLYQQGCFAGATALRVAKDIAENNRGARVLVVCSEITALTIRGPSAGDIGSLFNQSLFGDGASAIIVGAYPEAAESAIFSIVSASQTVLPGSDGAISAKVREGGFFIMPPVGDIAGIISNGVKDTIEEAFQKVVSGATVSRDWNSIFWALHPGIPAIVKAVEEKMGLKPERLMATRRVLAEYGNLSSATVLFILHEVRRRSAEEGMATTGEGLEWGVLFGIGPGITLETMVLRSAPIA